MLLVFRVIKLKRRNYKQLQPSFAFYEHSPSEAPTAGIPNHRATNWHKAMRLAKHSHTEII